MSTNRNKQFRACNCSALEFSCNDLVKKHIHVKRATVPFEPCTVVRSRVVTVWRKGDEARHLRVINKRWPSTVNFVFEARTIWEKETSTANGHCRIQFESVDGVKNLVRLETSWYSHRNSCEFQYHFTVNRTNFKQYQFQPTRKLNLWFLWPITVYNDKINVPTCNLFSGSSLGLYSQ